MKNKIESKINEYSLSANSISNSDLDFADKIVAIYLGHGHSSALSSNGSVFIWGSNILVLGYPQPIEKKLVPTDITSSFSLFGDKIVAISQGYSHSSAISAYGRVFTWGSDLFGQLGNNKEMYRFVPFDITSRFRLAAGDKIVAISLGDKHSSAISAHGRVFTWGSNLSGKLGDRKYDLSDIISVPNDITASFRLAAGDKIVAISLGDFHSSAISAHGRVFTWGSTSHGQLGVETYLDLLFNKRTDSWEPTDITSRFILVNGDKIVAISLGGLHSSAISAHGRVFTWGSNSHGQLGDGTTISKTVPTEITANFIMAPYDKIVSISLSSSNSSAISSHGRVFTWGFNVSGQLGDGTTTSKTVPNDITASFRLAAGDKIVAISLGDFHSSAISAHGRVFTWGSNTGGQLGDGTTTSKTVPTEITYNFNKQDVNR